MTRPNRLNLAWALALSLVALLGSAKPALASIDGTPVMLTLGDSFICGEGVEPFYDQDSPNKYQSDDFLGHRSQRAWPGTLKIGDTTMQKDQNWFFMAYSGAQTSNILQDTLTREWDRDGQTGSRDLPCQKVVFSDNNLKGKVDYITLSVGGNDIRFSELVTAACTDIPFISTGSFEKKLQQSLDVFDKSTKGNLSLIYDMLEQEAGPQAVTLVMGYPHLFGPNGRKVYLSEGSASSLISVDASEAKLFNEAVDTVDAGIEEVVQSKQRDNLVYVDVRSSFSGHEEDYMNPIWNYEQTYDLKEGASHYSAHPNIQGQQAYASVVQAKIDEIEQSKIDDPQDPQVQNTATVLVLDVSGSMRHESAVSGVSRLESAKRQSKDFVSTVCASAAQAGNVSLKIGVSTFSSDVARACSLSGDPATVNACIDSLEPWGRSNIYQGLADAIDQLSSQPGTKTMVLLSDGKRNEGKEDAEILALANQAAAAGITIHAIGYGTDEDINADLLRQVAQITGGVYAHEDASSLSTATVGLFAQMMSAELQATSELLLEDTSAVAQDATVEVGSFEVSEPGTMTAYLYGQGSELDMQLTDPDGIVVAEGYEGYAVDDAQRLTTITVKDTKQGTWSMKVFGREVTFEEEPFYVAASMNEAS